MAEQINKRISRVHRTLKQTLSRMITAVADDDPTEAQAFGAAF